MITPILCRLIIKEEEKEEKKGMEKGMRTAGKKLAVLFLVISMIVASFAACGGNGDGGGGVSEDDVVTFSITTGLVTADCFQNECVQRFADEVKGLSGGKLVCNVLAGASVGGEAAIIEALQMGTLEMAYSSDIGINQTIGTIGWALLPMMITTREDAETYYRSGWISEKISEFMLEADIVRLGEGNNSIRGLATTGEIIDSIDDLNGFKIRVPGLDQLLDFWSNVGAMSVSVASEEQVSALEQGVMNGIDNNLYGDIGNGVYDYLSVWIPTNHEYCSSAICASKDWYEGLPEQYQEWIRTAATNAGNWLSESTWELEEELMENMDGTSWTYVEIDEAFKTKLKEAGMKVWDKYRDKYPKEIMDRIYEDFGK